MFCCPCWASFNQYSGFEALARRLGLVYVETHDLPRRIEDIWRMGRVVILSHNSDGCIVPPGPGRSIREYDFVWQGIPDNIIHWFGQNVDINDARLTPIPIGLERVRWYPQLHKHEAMLSRATPRAAERPPGLCYLNANTRIRVQREELYRRFEGQDWVTAERGQNGIDFPHYARQLASHKFVLCPDGNGMDTHRTWEALYLGAFPIVQRHRFTEEFARLLPLVIVDDWGQVTREFLDSKYAEFVGRLWNLAPLTLSYWEYLIRSYL